MKKIVPGALSRAVPSPGLVEVAGKGRSEAAQVQRSFSYVHPKMTVAKMLVQSTQLPRIQSLVTNHTGTLGKSLQPPARVAAKQSNAPSDRKVGHAGDERCAESAKLVVPTQSAVTSLTSAPIDPTREAPRSSQADPGRADPMIVNAPKTTRSTEAAVTPVGSSALLTEKQVASMLSLEPATLRNWRVKGQGPRFVRLSRRAIRYSRVDVGEWLASRARRSTSVAEINHG
jgi:predicted DNA-binding transcriptional regulator AlpA